MNRLKGWWDQIFFFHYFLLSLSVIFFWLYCRIKIITPCRVSPMGWFFYLVIIPFLLSMPFSFVFIYFFDSPLLLYYYILFFVAAFAGIIDNLTFFLIHIELFIYRMLGANSPQCRPIFSPNTQEVSNNGRWRWQYHGC